MNASHHAWLIPILLAATSGQSAAVVNGSFETPVVTAPTQYQTIVGGGEPVGFGWRVVSGTVDAVIQGTQFGLAAFDGTQWLDLDGINSGAISQGFSTAVGNTYMLSFVYANNPHPESGATVPAGAKVTIVDSGSNADLVSPFTFQHSTSTVASLDWTTSGSILFVAKGPNTTVSFSSTDRFSSNGGVFLDAVNVTAVPEPSVSMLMLAGLLGVASLRRLGVRRNERLKALQS